MAAHPAGKRLVHKIYGPGEVQELMHVFHPNFTEDDGYFKPDVVPERFLPVTVFPIFFSDCTEE